MRRATLNPSMGTPSSSYATPSCARYRRPFAALGVSCLLAALPVLSIAPAAHAAPGESYARPDRQGGPEGHAGFRAGHRRLSQEERRALKEKVHKKMQARIAADLSERLGLDAEKSRQLSEVIEARGRARLEHGQRHRAAMRELRARLDAGAGDAALQEQMDVIAELRAERHEQMASLLEETRAFLSIEEQARLVLAFPRVMREARHLMHRARHGRKGHGPHREDGAGRRGPRFERDALGFPDGEEASDEDGPELD